MKELLNSLLCHGHIFRVKAVEHFKIYHKKHNRAGELISGFTGSIYFCL